MRVKKKILSDDSLYNYNNSITLNQVLIKFKIKIVFSSRIVSTFFIVLNTKHYFIFTIIFLFMSIVLYHSADINWSFRWRGRFIYKKNNHGRFYLRCRRIKLSGI